jgi:hypothetical protein
MSDNKKKVGSPDRDLVSGTEKYEVDYLAKKHQLPAPLVKRVIEQEGPSRQAVESILPRFGGQCDYAAFFSVSLCRTNFISNSTGLT